MITGGFGSTTDQGCSGEILVWRPRLEKPSRGMQGFALLTAAGPDLHAGYIDQDGKVVFQRILRGSELPRKI
jgi:hypothetical protein